MCFFCSFLLPASLSSLWFHSFFLSVLHRVLSSFWLICLVMIISGARSRVCGVNCCPPMPLNMLWMGTPSCFMSMSVRVLFCYFVVSFIVSVLSFIFSWQRLKLIVFDPMFPLVYCLPICLSFFLLFSFLPLFLLEARENPFWHRYQEERGGQVHFCLWERFSFTLIQQSNFQILCLFLFFA